MEKTTNKALKFPMGRVFEEERNKSKQKVGESPFWTPVKRKGKEIIQMPNKTS